MSDASVVPTKGEQFQAIALAALCAGLFVWAGLWPGSALVPYAPEVYEPARTLALSSGEVTADALEAGNISMGDKYHQSLAWDRIIQSRLRAGEFPLWTRDIAGGAPFVPQMGQPYQPWNVLLLVLPSAGWYGIIVFLQLVLLGWFAYRFFRRVGCAHDSALLGLVCAILGLWMQGRVHQNVVITAVLPLFLMLSMVHDLFHGPGGRGALRATGVLGVGAGLSWLAGFAPVSLQSTYICCAFAVVLAIATRQWKPLIWVGIGFALGAAIAYAQMGPTLAAKAVSARLDPTTADLAANGWAFQHLLSLIWPDLLIWPDPAPGDRASLMALVLLDLSALGRLTLTENSMSVGCVGLLAALSLNGRALMDDPVRRHRRALIALFVALTVLGVLFATARSPMVEITQWIPGARAGDLRRFLFSAHVGLTVLAAFGADRLVADARRGAPLIVGALVIAASTIVYCFFLFGGDAAIEFFENSVASALGGTREDLHANAEPGEVTANLDQLEATAVRTLAVVAGALGALLVLRRRAVLVIALLAMVELLHAGWGTRVVVDSERVTTPPDVLAPVLEATAAAGSKPRPRLVTLGGVGDLGPPRTLPVPNMIGFWGVEHIGAYNPLPKRRMEEFFLALEPSAEGKSSVLLGKGGSGVNGLFDPASLSHPLLDLLGVDWVLASRGVEDSRLSDRTPAGAEGAARIYARDGAMPRATFVDTARQIPAAGERLRLLGDPLHDPRRVVVLEDSAAPAWSGDGVVDAEVEVLEHSDELVVVQVVNREPGFLRLADPFDEGWIARDVATGVDLEVYVADHYLRAVALPPGDHRVEFRYAGTSVRVPQWIGLAGLMFALGLVLVGRRGRVKRAG